MTMEVVEKSKRENDSPVSTAASISWNEEEKSAGLGNSDKSDTPNTDSPTRDDNAQVFAEANDPAVCRPSPSRSDNPEEDVEDEKGVPLSVSDDRTEVDNAEDPTTPCKDDESPGCEASSGKIVEKLTAKNETEDSQEVISGPVTPQQPLTFTINFGDDKEVDTARYRNLFERYNARHKRNSSTSKVEVKSKKAPEAPVLSKQKTPSAHSEGYFSSDPEDDTRRKADQLSRKLKQLGLKSGSKVPAVPEKYDAGIMSRSYSEQSTREPEILIAHERVRSTRDNRRANRADMSLDLHHPANNIYDGQRRRVTAHNSSLHQNGKNRDREPEFVETEMVRSSMRNTEIRYERNYTSVNNSTERDNGFQRFADLDEKLSSGSSESERFFNRENSNRDEREICGSGRRSHMDNVNGQTNLDALEVSNFDEGSDGAVSEAGTYTIHKDYTDEEKARMDIDRVFGVGVVTEEESSEAYVHSFKMSISRDNNWISEWATQVAEHNSLPSAIGGMDVISKGLISPQSPQSPSKIPSPIHSRSRRLSRGRQDQSDSSLETESYLRVKATAAVSPSSHNDRMLVDSGGESDDDTSRSYNTPPQSLQRIGSARRASLSDMIFARNSISEGRRSARAYTGSDTRLRKDRIVTLQEPLRSPTHILARLQLGRRNSSLDRKEYASDTPESNCTSGRSSLKSYLDGTMVHPGSPVLARVRTPTGKLTTNSPIMSRKEIAPMRTSELAKAPLQAKNIGYFTCTENSPYMLRKSQSTTSYGHREDFGHRDRSRESCVTSVQSLHQNSPVPRRSNDVQRSASSVSVRNPQVTNLLTRRGSFNNNNNNTVNDRTAMAAIMGKFAVASDSSSEAGDKPVLKSPVPPVSSGIKLNRAFSIRRARLNCEYETTPNTTPEERRRKAQVGEIRGSQVSTPSRQTPTHRGRSAGNTVLNSKDTFKRPEPPKPRAPSMSRTDSGRISTRAPKNVNHVQHSRSNQKLTKDAHKKPGRSNSTLTSKEVEFQNWKRRKSYDPMKAAAEGKKKIDSSKKQPSIEDGSRGCESSVLRSASFHGTGGTLSLAAEWSENEFTDSNEYIRPPPPSSPQLGSDSDFETSSYLRTTENVVSAMSARMIVRHPPPVDSGGESDEDTSRSLHRPTHRGSLHLSRGSDTESSDEPRPPIIQSPVANLNHSKIIPSIRKTRTGPRDKKTPISLTKPKSSPRDARGNVDTTRVVARTDSGRFSTRAPKNINVVTQSKGKDNKKSAVPSSKEVEMQNWKRRKSYDPMKAAMEGRRKVNQTKRSPNVNSSPSHVLRSQSFHGSVGLGVSDWSDEELTVSADEASLY
ncbi:uncharacterized protein LOC124415019 [Diprion similis]|uniref:uncharacterized protein LOC124415019 n=1 Tax=Diprion similis TaxID=362088 RepID=UPI001EF91B53|nr:uncharacterized protein LOC124415019 [Diprion similis]XP_046752208.1 uncharacterized protein LOC124415019 [Diprion similis]